MSAPFTAFERETLNALLLRAAGVGDGATRDEGMLDHLEQLAGDPDAFRKAVAGFEDSERSVPESVTADEFLEMVESGRVLLEAGAGLVPKKITVTTKAGKSYQKTVMVRPEVAKAPRPAAKVDSPKASAGPPVDAAGMKAIITKHPNLGALAKTGHLVVSDADNPTVQENLSDLAKVPGSMHEAMKALGLGGVFTGNSTITGLDDMQKYKGFAPRNWPPGYTFDDLRGGFDIENKGVICGIGLGGGASVMLHEYGHGVGIMSGLVDSHETDAWHRSLYHNLGEYFRGGKPGSYAGRDELLAESFAHHYSGGPRAVEKWSGSKEYASWFAAKMDAISSGNYKNDGGRRS